MDRSPYLSPRSAGVVGWLLLAVAALATIGGAVTLIGALAGDDGDAGVTVAGGSATVPLLPGASVSVGEQTARLGVDGLPLGLRLLTVLGSVLALAALAVGALALARVLAGIRAGTPFAGRAATWWAVVAVAVPVGGVLGPLLDDVAALAALDRLDLVRPGAPYEASIGFSLAPLLVMVVLLGVAEAFRRGAAQAADVDGLV